MIVPGGDFAVKYYWEYINVDLGVLVDGEEVVHRAPALYRNRLLTVRTGSLMLTPRRVLFLSPPQTVARWRNCAVSLPLEALVRVGWRHLRPRLLFEFPEQMAIDTREGRRYWFSLADADEWCGAIHHQCELAR